MLIYMAGLVPQQFISKGLTKQPALAPVAKRVLAENRIHLFRLPHQKKQPKAQTSASQSEGIPAPRGGTPPPATGQGGDANCSSPGNNERLILVFLCKLAALLKGSRERQASARYRAQFGEGGAPFPAGAPFICVSPAIFHLRQERSG